MHIAKVREFERILVHNVAPLFAVNVRSREKYRCIFLFARSSRDDPIAMTLMVHWVVSARLSSSAGPFALVS